MKGKKNQGNKFKQSSSNINTSSTRNEHCINDKTSFHRRNPSDVAILFVAAARQLRLLDFKTSFKCLSLQPLITSKTRFPNRQWICKNPFLFLNAVFTYVTV